ncbi:alpha/beta fold hydrolase [Pseudarthrobacter sp. NamB4]|uniref:alpha/beta fold hydrolase n=1 Tax=Pseudarthrobacter sp. NamB4 TaxID=2576837 RepID=UPI0010FDC18F|nr:alpha/beta fold hydrolase [Pseudarthrobacter sp. NamB4]TLM72929.1 alpha/beta fold hydrolase [Pseudarthrobacter sp. NamB4]
MTVKSQADRKTVEVKGTSLSYLDAGSRDAPPLLLLHGTFWSRVWQPVLPLLAGKLHCMALDFPGFGRSEGELHIEDASVPALAQVVEDAADALGLDTFAVAAHDIGGGVAQHLAAYSGRVTKLVLVNAVMFDSWPVPAVERFRDQALRAATSPEELLAARTKTMQLTVKRPLSSEEIDEYVSPWQDPARGRSWMAMAGAADARYTLDLLPALKDAAVATRLIWGRGDDFQKVSFARRYVSEIPSSDLVQVAGRHIPMEDSPREVAAAMLEHLA